MRKRGLFIGLATLDLIYLIENLPDRNQKIVALDSVTAAGGPATNAAVAFCHLGNAVTLLSALGNHSLSQLIRAELEQWQVTIADLDPTNSEPAPTASILVTQATGDRAVVSLNTAQSQAAVSAIPPGCLQAVDIVLIDGHQMAVGQAIARQAQAINLPVVVDGGSWKPGFEALLPQVDYAICSANFYPPVCQSAAQVFDYLESLNIPHMAITNGDRPIQFRSMGKVGEVATPQIRPIDTLGAGDFFHGAFCHFILSSSFPEALAQAAEVAAYSCQFFGTRKWMRDRRGEG